MADKCKILLADDHPIVRWGLKSCLEKHLELSVVAQASNSTELFEALAQQHIDVVITDYTMPGGKYQDGIVMLDRLRRCYPDIKVIVLTLLRNPALLARIADAPVDAILNKEGEIGEIALAVSRVKAGFRYFGSTVTTALEKMDMSLGGQPTVSLSPRELEVLRMFLQGMPMKSIAEETFRSIKTISNQKQSAMRKMGCANDAELFQLHALGGLGDILQTSTSKPSDSKVDSGGDAA